jgi:hypothetical protein
MLDQSEKQLDNSNKSEAPECLNLLSVAKKNVPASQGGAQHKDQLQYPKMEAHPGSYYHKVYSPCGSWTGIEGVVTLGAPHLDPKRIHKGVAQDTRNIKLGDLSGEMTVGTAVLLSKGIIGIRAKLSQCHCM